MRDVDDGGKRKAGVVEEKWPRNFIRLFTCHLFARVRLGNAVATIWTHTQEVQSQRGDGPTAKINARVYVVRRCQSLWWTYPVGA